MTSVYFEHITVIVMNICTVFMYVTFHFYLVLATGIISETTILIGGITTVYIPASVCSSQPMSRYIEMVIDSSIFVNSQIFENMSMSTLIILNLKFKKYTISQILMCALYH